MDSYTRLVAENPKIEWIHVSQDSSESSATSWAKQANFPWITLMSDNVGRTNLMDLKTSNSVPHYILADKEGNLIVSGQTEVFAKIAELTKGE